MAWTPSEQSEQADQFQQTLFEKEKVIKNLEGEVESQVNVTSVKMKCIPTQLCPLPLSIVNSSLQRQQRLADAKQVEAKAARIKDWVTNKLKELEEQNQHLREQNAHCNEQMELLRNRLEQLQELGQTCSKTNSRRESGTEVRLLINSIARLSRELFSVTIELQTLYPDVWQRKD